MYFFPLVLVSITGRLAWTSWQCEPQMCLLTNVYWKSMFISILYVPIWWDACNQDMQIYVFIYFYILNICSVQSVSCVWLFATPWTAVYQASLSVTNSGVCSNSCPSIWWCYPTISSLSSPSPPAPNLSQHQGLFQWVSSLHQVAKVLEFQLQSFQWTPRTDFLRMDWLDLLAVQGTQESSPTPQFKSINSSALSFLYSPTLTSIHDYWKNHSFDHMDFCWQSNVSVF